MRAIFCEVWGEPEQLVLKEVPTPVAGPGQVRIKIHAAGVNFPDVLIIQKKYQLRPELPFIPGAELSGEVVELGAGVTTLAKGDRIAALCATGGFAEEIVLDAQACARLPPGMGYETAAGFTLAYGTAWHALRDRANLRPGETLLVLGAAGGVGLAAVQIGKILGAKVAAAARGDAKCAVCREHGADEIINTAAEDLRAGIKRACGAGPDVVFDPVGGSATEAAFRAIAWRGRHLVIGFAAGDIPALPLNLALLKGASLTGVFWGEFVRREPENHVRGMAELYAWVQAGRLNPLISKTYPLAQTAAALRDLADRKVIGKIIITP